MSVPAPILTEGGFDLLTETPSVLLTEGARSISGDFSNAAPYAARITSEHNQKPKFMSMVSLVTGAIGDVLEGIQSIEAAFDLDNAIGVQQDILGLWIGQPRVVSQVLVQGLFGFSETSTGQADGAQLPFGELTNPTIGGRFYELGQIVSGTTTLSDPEYLTILKARIVRNQSDGTLAAIENALQFIFGVPCSVADNGTLSIVINVGGAITPTQQALLTSLDLLPRPACVSISAITFTGNLYRATASCVSSALASLTAQILLAGSSGSVASAHATLS
jgi:hypothetical protein